MVLPQIRYNKFKSKRHFGIELEVSPNLSKEQIRSVIQSVSETKVRVTDWEQSINNSSWCVKHDSTCGPNATERHHDYGWEIASYKAKGIADILHMAAVADALKKNGLQVNDNCGFHIHTEIADFEPNQTGILLANWIKIEPYVCCMVPNRRRKNIHCKLWGDQIDKNKTYTGESLWKAIKPTNFSPSRNPQKRVALNFVNYAASLYYGRDFERKTVELRLPEGTLNGEDIANWIKFIVCLVEHSKVSEMPSNLYSVGSVDEFLSYLGLGHDRGVFTLCSVGMYKFKEWLLSRIIQHSYSTAIRDDAQNKLNAISNLKSKDLQIPVPEQDVEDEDKPKDKEYCKKIDFKQFHVFNNWRDGFDDYGLPYESLNPFTEEDV